MYCKILLRPAGIALMAAVAVKKSETDDIKPPQPQNSQQNVLKKDQYKCKLDDLPLYTPLHAYKKPQLVSHPMKTGGARGVLESGVSVVRQEVQSGYKAVADQTKVLNNYIDTAKAHSMEAIDYLNEPHNTLPRSGAIAIGGLAGFIFAARGGFFKKLIYATTGSGIVASICYPHQAEDFARDALHESRKGFAIVYNFVNGVKPGDEGSTTPEPISKFPTSLEDLKYLAWDLYDEAKEALLPKKK